MSTNILKGQLGFKGARGYSAYEIAVQNGFEGSESEWLNQLGVSSHFMSAMYPVGSIYISVSETNPEVLFGGTWEQIKDTFLLASGNTYPAGSTGGEATHVLTASEMPNHRHGVANANENGADLAFTPVLLGENNKGWEGSAFTSYEGGGQAHNNMPPYLTVYMWKRIG